MNSSTQLGLLGKLIGFMVMSVMLVLGLMFSVVVLAGVLFIGLTAFGYFWWKARGVRRRMKEQAAGQVFRNGTIIDGEAVIVEDEAKTKETLLIVKSQGQQP